MYRVPFTFAVALAVLAVVFGYQKSDYSQYGKHRRYRPQLRGSRVGGFRDSVSALGLGPRSSFGLSSGSFDAIAPVRDFSDFGSSSLLVGLGRSRRHKYHGKHHKYRRGSRGFSRLNFDNSFDTGVGAFDGSFGSRSSLNLGGGGLVSDFDSFVGDNSFSLPSVSSVSIAPRRRKYPNHGRQYHDVDQYYDVNQYHDTDSFGGIQTAGFLDGPANFGTFSSSLASDFVGLNRGLGRGKYHGSYKGSKRSDYI